MLPTGRKRLDCHYPPNELGGVVIKRFQSCRFLNRIWHTSFLFIPGDDLQENKNVVC